jgi:hypothetical protein
LCIDPPPPHRLDLAYAKHKFSIVYADWISQVCRKKSGLLNSVYENYYVSPLY